MILRQVDSGCEVHDGHVLGVGCLRDSVILTYFKTPSVDDFIYFIWDNTGLLYGIIWDYNILYGITRDYILYPIGSM
jgi:hypothetical protein